MGSKTPFGSTLGRFAVDWGRFWDGLGRFWVDFGCVFKNWNVYEEGLMKLFFFHCLKMIIKTVLRLSG